MESNRAPRRDFDRVEPRVVEAREDFDAPVRRKAGRPRKSDDELSRQGRYTRAARARAKTGEPPDLNGRKDAGVQEAVIAAAPTPEFVARVTTMTEEAMRAEMRKHVGLAVDTIVDIMSNGHKEPSRLAAARTVLVHAFAAAPGVRTEPPGKKEQAEIDARAVLYVPDSEWGDDLAGRATVN